MLGLALLVALSSSTAMAAVAGARRGDTAVERLAAVTSPFSIAVLPNQSGFDWGPVRALPGVDGLTQFVLGGFRIDELGPQVSGQAIGFPPGDDQAFTVERPVVLDGRLPDPTRADEVVVTSKFRSLQGFGVGDILTIHLFSPQQAAADENGPDSTADPAGPKLRATVVGVVRSPWYSDTVDGVGGLIPSPGLYARYKANLAGPNTFVNALARLHDGPAGIERFKQQLATVTGREDIDVWNLAEQQAHAQDVTGFEARSLLAFALAVVVASLVLVGQAVTRFTAGVRGDIETMRAIGLERRSSRQMVLFGPVAAAVVGSIVGVIGAVLASQWFPLGAAALLEPNPGIDVDRTVLVVGGLAVPMMVAAGALLTARSWRLATRAQRRSGTPFGRLVGNAPVPAAVGVGFAFDRGPGGRAAGATPAIAGAIVGVAGVIAAMTFSAGVSDATAGYARFGQTYDMYGWYGFNGQDFGDVQQTLATTAADPDVEAVDNARMDVAQSGAVAVSLFTLDEVEGPHQQPFDVVVTEGRLPARAGEVALAPRSVDAIGVEVGDQLSMTGSVGTVALHVVGEAFVPAGPHNDYASGGWLTPTTYDRLFTGFKFHFGLIDLAPGADPSAVAARLHETAKIDVVPGLITQPPERAELRQLAILPRALAVFLALLALGAVGHALGVHGPPPAPRPRGAAFAGHDASAERGHDPDRGHGDGARRGRRRPSARRLGGPCGLAARRPSHAGGLRRALGMGGGPGGLGVGARAGQPAGGPPVGQGGEVPGGNRAPIGVTRRRRPATRPDQRARPRRGTIGSWSPVRPQPSSTCPTW